MPQLRAIFELLYLCTMTRLLQAANVGESAVGLNLTALPEQWGDFDLLRNPARWLRKLMFEWRRCAQSANKLFVKYHNVKDLSTQPHNLPIQYLGVPSSWTDGNKPACSLAVPTELASVYQPVS